MVASYPLVWIPSNQAQARNSPDPGTTSWFLGDSVRFAFIRALSLSSFVSLVSCLLGLLPWFENYELSGSILAVTQTD